MRDFSDEGKAKSKISTSPSVNIDQVDTEPLKRKRQTSNSSGDGQEEVLSTPKSDLSPTKEETTTPPSTEPIKIRSRLPAWDRPCPRDWWKPWEPTNTSSNKNSANSAHKPLSEPKNYAEAWEHPDTSSWQRAT